MKVKVVTPVGPLFEGEAQRIAATGVEGAFEVWEGHAPLVAQLAPGPLHIDTHTFSLAGGFLWVAPTGEVHVVAQPNP